MKIFLETLLKMKSQWFFEIEKSILAILKPVCIVMCLQVTWVNGVGFKCVYCQLGWTLKLMQMVCTQFHLLPYPATHTHTLLPVWVCLNNQQKMWKFQFSLFGWPKYPHVVCTSLSQSALSLYTLKGVWGKVISSLLVRFLDIHKPFHHIIKLTTI